MPAPPTARAVVVGGGVVGLSCAVRFAESGWDVEVVAAAPPQETTSSVAGALWMPYRAEPADRVASWARTTLVELQRLHRHGIPGVRLLDGVLLHGASADPLQRPSWTETVADLVPVRPVLAPAPGHRHGLAMSVPLVDMSRYLPWLARRLHALGGRLRLARLLALPEPSAGDVVVDAAGLGARELAADAGLHAVRGQVVITSDPGLTRFLVDEHEVDGELTYVLPHGDHVIVGGCAIEGDEDQAPRADLAARILHRAHQLEPRLQHTRVLGHRVGLRPGRAAVRLEVEHRDRGRVVHCYGHGGSGLTLSWGCADDVLTLARGEVG